MSAGGRFGTDLALLLSSGALVLVLTAGGALFLLCG